MEAIRAKLHFNIAEYTINIIFAVQDRAHEEIFLGEF